MPRVLESTPIDEELTRLPLPVLMTSTDFSFREANFHHHFHPEKSSQLGYDPATGLKFPYHDERTVAGLALRSSRGQKIPFWLHSRYHRFFSGPPLPEAIEEQFKSVVLACTGVVPGQAIDLYTPGEFQIVDLTPKQHEFIRRRIFFEGAPSGDSRSRKDTIGRFLANYTIENSLSEVISEREVRKKVQELLAPRSEEQRIAAGRFILTHALDASVASIIPIHQEAKKAGLVKHPRRSLVDVALRFFSEDKFVDYYDTLKNRVRLLET